MNKPVIWMLAVVLVLGAQALASPDVTAAVNVIDAAGKPLAGAKVALFSSERALLTIPKFTRLVEVSADGNGSARLRAPAAPLAISIIVAGAPDKAIGFANWDRSADREFKLTLGEPKTLAGVVVDASGKPVADASVHAAMARGRGADVAVILGFGEIDALIARTGADGRFAFTNVPGDATADFFVTAVGFATASTVQATRGGVAFAHVPGRDDIRIVMRPEVQISGQALAKDGRPVPGVQLVAEPAMGRALPPAEATTNRGGRFTFTGLGAGTFNITVAPQVNAPAEWICEPATATTEVGKPAADVKLQMVKGGLLEVKAVDAESGQAVPDAMIVIDRQDPAQPAGSDVQPIYSDKDGLARVRLMPGAYALAVFNARGYAGPPERPLVELEEGKTANVTVELKMIPTPGPPATAPAEGTF